MDNGWFIGLADEVLIDFNKTIIKYPSIKRIPGGASNDLVPNFEHANNSVPLMDLNKPAQVYRGGDG